MLERTTARHEDTRRCSNLAGSLPDRNQTPRLSPTYSPSPTDSTNDYGVNPSTY